MKTKSTLFVASIFLLFARFSANAQCSVTIAGSTTLGGQLAAKTGDCHVEVLQWQVNGQDVYTSYQTQYKRKGAVVAGGNDYGATSTQLASPGDVHVDAAGNVYVLDGNNNRVQKWAPGATEGVTVAGGNGLGSASNQLFLPQGFYVDGIGNVYIADLFNNRVEKWVPGATSGVIVAGGNGYGAGANQLASPKDVFVDGSGNVYVTDADNNRVQRWAPGATMGVTVAGGNGYGSNANQFRNPFGIFVDAAGNIYVSDRSNNRVQKWAPGASAGETVAGGNGSGEDSTQLNDPRGLFVDNMGRVYVCDYFNNRIQKWVTGMNFGVTVAGGRGVGSQPGRLNHPAGLSISTSGDMYVADEGNNRVQKYEALNFIRNKFTASAPGKYRVIAVCSNGLVDTSAEVEIGMSVAIAAPVSVEHATEGYKGRSSVFPNPAADFTTVKFSAAKQETATIQVIDISGKALIRINYNTIPGINQVRLDVSKLSAGTYVINIISENKVQHAMKLNKL
ncbi:T9SS type A sorting domain-containing protein [Panacibacter sp. DH6]|uniref:T9SS type A sorting domain-containing protein n=1 Tax=Panacibacter microcysteis TaxID=2793269 RepID=A0A931EA48_9BACT|nr:T9SS type A sorting domain-containing protein [Panacibacter microcysteis]MBG9376989.1 T9SS type A sorting domain-containing protein [Panacibacter microcysteis]